MTLSGSAAQALVLAIETSNPSAAGDDAAGPGVALGVLGHDGPARVLGTEPLRTREPAGGGPARGGHDDDLMPAIDRLFRAAGVRARDLAGGRVGVSVGPGGYTGLRVACAAGKMVAEASGAGCVPVPTDAVVAARVGTDAWLRGAVVVVLASKGESAWARVYQGPGRPRDAGGLVTAACVPAWRGAGVGTVVADRFLPATVRAACGAAGVPVVEPVFDPVACLELAAALPVVDPVELVPVYPREPDAVTLWRARRGAGGT